MTRKTREGIVDPYTRARAVVSAVRSSPSMRTNVELVDVLLHVIAA